MERDELDRWHRRRARQPPLGAADFGRARQESQHGAGFGAQRRRDGIRHLALDRRIGVAPEIARSTGKARPSLSTTGASPSSLADPRAVERRRHHEEAQILAQAPLRVARQRQAEIGIERALVEFVEQHRGDAASSGSSRIRRVKMPSVTTSMRVARETFEPKRTR